MAKKRGKARKAVEKKKTAVPKKLRYWEGNVPENFAFFMCDGRVLKNLRDLAKALDEISDDVFHRHANSEKNDFSSWIRDIMHCHDLAHNILGKDKVQTRETIMLYVKKKTGKKALA